MKSEQHHWWPTCLSRHWARDDGGVTWLRADGTEKSARPRSFGAIGNGHFMKLGQEGSGPTVWDQNFERVFQNSDDYIPQVIAYLEGMTFEARLHLPLRDRFLYGAIPDDLFDHLIEALVSLAIRSPMTREAAVGLAERLRGALPERERNSLIAANIRDMQKYAFRSLRGRGKVAVIYSPYRELVFGDGFYHNLTSVSSPLITARILAPLTPRLAVLYAVPMSYEPKPRLSTLVIHAEHATMLNDAVQVYARNAIFYRSEKPEIRDHFTIGSHMRYSSPENPVEEIVYSMPGIRRRVF